MASPASLYLLQTSMAVPTYVADDVVVGRCVFQNFIHQEFEEEGVPDEILDEVPEEGLEEIVPEQNAASANYADESFASALEHVGPDPIVQAMEIGIRLRECADAFAKSEQRKEVRKEAEKVSIETISYEGFFTICDQVFMHGFNRVNIVALFYFCADVVKRCVKMDKREIGVRLFKWALQYVVDQVCAWVARHGGWEKAIKNTFSAAQIAALGAGAVVVVAFCGLAVYKLSR